MGSEGRIVEIVGGFVDLSRNWLVRGGAWERIPPKEVELLRHLAGRPGVDVAAEDLFREVWRIDSSTYRATLQTTVHRLRKKIEADPHAPRIVVNGSDGYRYVPLPVVERAPLPGEDVVPDPPSSFVGRREELGAVHAALLRGARAVVFKGAAGIGKTRLAARYARSGDARAWGAGAVVFVEVAEARTSVALAQALARALGLDLRVGPGGLDWAARAGRALAARGTVLVVLDGLESALPHGARLLGRWAADAPESRFLVTTRILPHLEGAEVVELAPLSGGDGAALYADRAGGTAGDPDLVALLERLGGNPLGIELVASWADVFTPRTLLRRLSALDLQRRGGGRRGNRHDSLREAIAGSWALLRPEPQRVLAACSVFRGGFTVEGLTAVGAAGGAQADATARALETLVEHSLVRIRPRPDGGAERFVLDEPVRAFAAERLAASGREGEVRARRAEWAARFGEERAVAAELGTDPRALRDLAGERRNLAAALEECADPDVSLRLALVLDTVAGLLGPPEGRVERLDRALARGGEAAPGLLGRVHYARAVAIRDRGRPRASHADFGAAMERARQAGDEALAARALAGLGNAHGLVGELATAEALLTRAREVAEPLDRGPLLGGILGDLGTVRRRRGDAQAAEELYRAALVAARRGGDRRGEGRVLGMLALLRNRQGRWEEAAEHHRRELEIAGEIGDRRWRGTALSNLGRVEAESGRLAEAETALREALALHREVGNAAHEAITRCNLGMARLEAGDIAEADELVGDALALHVELGDRFHEAVARIDLGWIRLWQGRRADAEACADLAREVATCLADRALQGHALLFRGAVAARALEVEAAAASVDEAAALMGGGVPVDLGRAAVRAAGARLAGDRGPDDARRGRREGLDLLPRWDDGGVPGGSDARLWIRLVREILAPSERRGRPGGARLLLGHVHVAGGEGLADVEGGVAVPHQVAARRLAQGHGGDGVVAGRQVVEPVVPAEVGVHLPVLGPGQRDLGLDRRRRRSDDGVRRPVDVAGAGGSGHQGGSEEGEQQGAHRGHLRAPGAATIASPRTPHQLTRAAGGGLPRVSSGRRGAAPGSREGGEGGTGRCQNLSAAMRAEPGYHPARTAAAAAARQPPVSGVRGWRERAGMASGHAGIGWGAGRAAITGFLPAVEVSRRDPGPSLARLAAVGLARRAEAVVARATEPTGEGLGLLEGFFRAVREQRFGDAFDALEAVARRHPSPMDPEDLAEVPALLVELCFEGLARDAEKDRISPSWMRRAELLRPPADRARMEYVQYGWIRMGQAVQHYGDGDPTGARVAFAESERHLTTGLHPSARDPDMRQAIARARRALAPALADREPTAPDYVSGRGLAQHWIGRIEGREGPGYTVRVTYASALSKYARGAEIAVSSDEIELLTRVSLDATLKGWR